MNRVIVMGVLALCCLSAQEKETPPAGGPPKPFKVPARQTSALKNGVRITTVPYGVIPKATISVIVRTGNVHEAADQIWLADLTGDLMKEGAGSRNGTQIAGEAARMGGQLGIAVGPDQVNISISVLSEFANDAVALLADVVQRPTFPEGELNRIKTDKLRQLSVALSSPGAIADDLFRKAIYPDHPYGRIFPTEAMLNGYTIENVRKFYKSNFGAKRTHVYVAGRFDPSVARSLTSAFENWAPGAEQAYPPAKPVAAKELITSDRPGAAQSTVRIGLPAPDPSNKDYIPMQVTNALLGGTFMSRITTNIREQKGYTYSPYSLLSSEYHQAFWVENADITTDKTGPAITEIIAEINKLRRNPPPAKEVEAIQAAMSGTFVLRNSSPDGIINQLAFVDLQGLGDDWLKQWVQRVNAVKPGDIQRISETYLNPDKMTLVVVGDLAKIKDQIAPFNSKK
jgi:predicted Zn-dependent peptidase